MCVMFINVRSFHPHMCPGGHSGGRAGAVQPRPYVPIRQVCGAKYGHGHRTLHPRGAPGAIYECLFLLFFCNEYPTQLYHLSSIFCFDVQDSCYLSFLVFMLGFFLS